MQETDRASPKRYLKMLKLRDNVSQAELESIFLNDLWPRKRFIKVAEQLNLTMEVFRPIDDATPLRRLIKNQL